MLSNMTRLVKVIGTGLTGIGMESGPKMQVAAAASPIRESFLAEKTAVLRMDSFPFLVKIIYW